MSSVVSSVDEALARMGKVNVLIAGRTGAGKSTLINAVFRDELAETGQGRPVTASVREISRPGLPITILDTRGLEMGAYQQSLGELEAELARRARESDADRHVHVAWVCIPEDGRRVEMAESALVERLSRLVPVLVIITKARADRGFCEEVARHTPEARGVVRVRALAEELDDGHALPPSGLEELVARTGELVPEGRRAAFAAALRASLTYKRHVAGLVIDAAAKKAGLLGAAGPLGAAAVTAVQLGMLSSICLSFGLSPVAVSSVEPVFREMLRTGVVRGLLGPAVVLLPFVGIPTAAAGAWWSTRRIGLSFVDRLVAAFVALGTSAPDAEALRRALG